MRNFSTLSEEEPLSFQLAPSTPGHSWAVSHRLFTELGSHSHRLRPRPPTRTSSHPGGKGRGGGGGLRSDPEQTLSNVPAWPGPGHLQGRDTSPGDLPTVTLPGGSPIPSMYIGLGLSTPWAQPPALCTGPTSIRCPCPPGQGCPGRPSGHVHRL